MQVQRLFVRWNSATMGFINPVDFIPLAEYLGLIKPDRGACIKRGGEALQVTGMTWDILTTKVNVNLSVVLLQR